MSNVLVEKNKIDILANAISTKSGEPLTLTLDEMVEAVDGIETGGITPSGNIDITSAGVTDVTNYATATVPQGEMNATSNWEYYTENGQRKWRYRGEAVIDTNDGYGTPGFIADGTYVNGNWNPFNAVAKNTTVTPSTSAQTIGGANYMMEGAVTVNAIPSNHVGTNVPKKSSADLTESGSVVTAPSGYYSTAATKSISGGTATAPTSISSTGATVTTGTNTITLSKTVSVTPSVTAGYISAGTAGNASVALTATVSTRSSANLTVSGSEVTAPSGFYSANATKAVSAGTAGTPTATKGTVNNHSVSVTPAVTNTTGYITGGTLTGTAVTVSASELVSGSSSITANASGIDVTNLSTVDVNVAGGATTLQTKTKSYTPSTKQQTEAITYDEGYDGLDTVNVTVDAMATGQALPPATLIGNGVLSFDTNKVILSQNFMTSAIVTSGYISSATTALTSVSLSATLSTRSEADLTASGSVVTAKSGYYSASASKAVSAGTAGTPTASKGTVTNNAVSVTPKVTNTTGYITGGTLTGTAVTVSASELVSGTSTLTQNTTYDVTNLSSVTVNVPTSGGGFQGYFLSSSNLGTITTTSTTAYALNKSLTITNVYGYDGLLVETSVDSQTNGRHTATTGLFWLTGSTNIATKTSGVTANARWNARRSANGTSTTRASTTAYGVFGSTCTMSTSSNGTATITMYARYNSTHTGTMNGNYTARVYGFNIANLIGG